jgi:DNA-binding transcriptional LysR family regulator
MFTKLSYFAEIVEQQSLNRAARRLNVSQPALSRHLRALEDEVGLKLFDRIGKRLHMTPAGDMLYRFALEERRLERRYRQAFSEWGASGRSTLTIGASLTTLQATLPDLIASFTAAEPDTDITAVTGKTHEIVAMVKERKVDVGLIAARIEEPSIVCVPLFDDHLSLVVPRHHPLARKTALRLDDVRGLPMILFSKGTWFRSLTDEWFERYGIDPLIKMEIDSFEAILRLLDSCRAVTLLPKSYLRPIVLEDNGLIRLDLEELKQTVRTTSLIRPEGRNVKETVERFITLARQQFADHSRP